MSAAALEVFCGCALHPVSPPDCRMLFSHLGLRGQLVDHRQHNAGGEAESSPTNTGTNDALGSSPKVRRGRVWLGGHGMFNRMQQLF